MKKVRLVVVIALVALMAMGIGYAYWSQTINMIVDGSMANLEITPSSTSPDVTVDTQAKTISISAEALAPGETRTYKFKLTNDGTLAATQSSFEIKSVTGSPAVIGAIEVYIAGNHTALQPDTYNVLPYNITIEPTAFKEYELTISLPNTVDNSLNMKNKADRDFGFTFTYIFVQKP